MILILITIIKIIIIITIIIIPGFMHNRREPFVVDSENKLGSSHWPGDLGNYDNGDHIVTMVMVIMAAVVIVIMEIMVTVFL